MKGTKNMNGQISIILNKEELMEIETILMDDDSAEALKFVRDVISAKVKENTGEHCKPWE